MHNNKEVINFSQIDEISGGDGAFKKELIELFMNQIPEFIENMNNFQNNNDLESLAREAHTAKSSALIFGMKETGEHLKQIQTLAENKETLTIPTLILEVNNSLSEAKKQLKDALSDL